MLSELPPAAAVLTAEAAADTIAFETAGLPIISLTALATC